MPSDDQSSPPYRSPYPELTLPAEGFRSKIPDHLLSEADPATRWIMEEMSKNTQATEWACHGLLDTNLHVRKTNGRLLRAEDDLKKTREDLEDLKAKATVAEPLLKPMAQFMALWEYRAFRWVFYFAGFFLITYALPAYLANPISLKTLFTFLVGP